jgi:hypothetical protein
MNELRDHFFTPLKNPWVSKDAHLESFRTEYNFPEVSQELLSNATECHQSNCIFKKFEEFVVTQPHLENSVRIQDSALNNLFRNIKEFRTTRTRSYADGINRQFMNKPYELQRYRNCQISTRENFNQAENIKQAIFHWCQSNNVEVTSDGKMGYIAGFGDIGENIIEMEGNAISNWQFEIRLGKKVTLNSKLKINKIYFALQPKLYFNKRSLGVRLDLFDKQCINSSVLLKYKNYIVGFQNHRNQPHMAIGKNILSHDQFGTININGLLAVTSNKEKFLDTSKFNVDVHKNLIKQEFLNPNSPKILSKDIGFQSKCIVNLFSFEKKKKKLNKLSIESPKQHVQTNVKTLSLSQNENSLHNQNFDELALVFPKFREARHSNRADLKLNECIHVSLDPCPIKFNGSNSVARLSGGALLGLFVFYIGGLIKRSIFDKSCEDIFYE